MEKRSPLLSLNSVVALGLILFIILTNGNKHQVAAQVFCRPQFNLANEACSLKIFQGVNPKPLQHNESASSYNELQASRSSRHRRHHHHGDLTGDPFDTACCRRLRGIDNACICQAMTFLPMFMSRVKHVMTLTPIPGCDVSFECAAAY